MKKSLIGATAALALTALGGAGASAQGAYTFPDDAGVSGVTTCVAANAVPPPLEFDIDLPVALKGPASYTLRFERDGEPFGAPVGVPGPVGTTDFPTQGDGSAGGFEDDGWTDEEGELWPGPTIVGPDGVTVVAVVVDEGDGDATYTSDPSAVTFVDDACIAAQPPPPQPSPPPPSPPTPGPEVQPPPTPLPATGMTGFETSLRIGALLMIGGLGFVIVARRRRFAATTAGT